jgi:hypothetical protein
MKNKLTDLNNHLFAQLERLSDEDLTASRSTRRGKARRRHCRRADQIVRGADLQLKAVTILANHGARVGHHLTMLEDRQPPALVAFQRRAGAISARRWLRRKKPPAASRPLQGEGRSVKGRPIRYSAEEMAWLEANRLMVISDYAAAFAERFGRDISAHALHALRKRKGWKTGRTGCFEKGAEPHNKGKPCPEGKGGRHPNARKTQFGKGHEPHNTKWLGHERVSKTAMSRSALPRRTRTLATAAATS